MLEYCHGDVLPSGWVIDRYLDAGVNNHIYTIYHTTNPDELWSLRVSQVPKRFSQVAHIFEKPDRSGYLSALLNRHLQQYKNMEQLSHIPYIPSPVVVDIQPQRSGIGWYIQARMPLLQDLLEHFHYAPPTEQEVVTLGQQMAIALGGLHGLGYIHRDVSLNNMMRHPEGRYQLIDFGNEISLEDAKKGYVSQTTPTPPEAALGEPFDETADVYALGLCLYRLLNHNEFPFCLNQGQDSADAGGFAMERTPAEVFCRLRFTTPWPEPLHGTDALKAVIRKACHMDAKQRYPSMEALGEALSACAKSTPSGWV